MMPRQGVIDLIEYAKNNQLKLGFVTSTTKDNINSVFLALKNYFNKDDFDFVGNNTMVKNPKPHSDIYIEAIKILNVEPKECIAIEDSRASALYLRIMQKFHVLLFLDYFMKKIILIFVLK